MLNTFSKILKINVMATVFAITANLSFAQEYADIATTDGIVADALCIGSDDTKDIDCSQATAPVVDASGNLGVATSAPATALDVSGTLRISNGGETCDASVSGALRYNTASSKLELCDSTAWVALADGNSGGSLWTDNGDGTIRRTSRIQIGTAATGTPSAALHIRDANPYIKFQDTGNAGNSPFWSVGVADNGSVSRFDIANSFDAGTYLQRMTLLENGNVGIGTVSPNYELDVSGTIHANTVSATQFIGDGSLLTGLDSLWTQEADGISRTGFKVFDSGSTPSFAANSRVAFWHADKGAFRIGNSRTDNFDDSNIGSGSFAVNAKATGTESIALGSNSTASNFYAVSLGASSTASGMFSTTFGLSSTASAMNSRAFGNNSTASGTGAIAFGDGTIASNSDSMAFLVNAQALGQRSLALGYNSIASGNNSATLGGYSKASNSDSIAIGFYAISSGENAIALGEKSEAAAANAIAIGDNAHVTGTNSVMLNASDTTGTILSDSNTIALMGATGGVGVGTVSPDYELDVSGTIHADVVSATTFVGDGSGLTGVVVDSVVMGIDDLTDAKHDADDYSSLFIGNGAGANDDGTANANVAIGLNALTVNTSGVQNVAIGVTSLKSNTTGNFNTGIGVEALLNNTTGSGNVATGAVSLRSNTVGDSNSAYGFYSLFKNTLGSSNTAIGKSALYENIDGTDNIALGEAALLSNVSGQYNTAIGNQALRRSISDRNIAIGESSLAYNTTGQNNTSMGYHSAAYNKIGSQNVLLGAYVAKGTVDSSDINNSVMIGYESGMSVLTGADDNTFIGYQSGDAVTTGARNILIGSGVDTSAPTASDELNIGNVIYGDLAGGTVTVSNTLIAETVSATAFVGDGSGLTGVSGLWTDAGDYINYNNARFYKQATTIDVSHGEVLFIWDEDKGAIRAGQNEFNDWDDANIGSHSIAMGLNNRASGSRSVALGGHYARATNTHAIALGAAVVSSGFSSFAVGGNGDINTGFNTLASSTRRTEASGSAAVAFQKGFATADYARALGYHSNATADYATALGSGSQATGTHSVTLGSSSTASGAHSVAVGQNAKVSGANSVVIAAGDVTGTELSAANTVAILGATGGVGIGTVSPNYELDVSGTIHANTVSATQFIGDGSGLTGVVGTPAGTDMQIQFNDNGTLAGSNLIYDKSLNKLRAGSGSLDNFIVSHSLGGGYAGALNVGTNNPGTYEGALHIAVAGYNEIPNPDQNYGIMMLGTRDGQLDNTPKELLEGDTLPGIGFAGFKGTTLGTDSTVGASIHGIVDGTVSSSALPTGLMFRTRTAGSGLSEKMRISSNGNVGIGTTTPTAELDVSGSIVYSGTLTDISDERLKDNIENLPEGQLENIDKIRPVSFTMKGTNETEFGVIAQEIEAVYPQLVKTADDERQTKSVNYMGLLAPMVQAMQELKAENDALRKQNTNILSRLEQLEKAMSSVE